MKITGKELTEKMLRDYPQARQDDKVLQLLVWREQGLPITKEFASIFRGHSISSPESIRRVRQKLQEDGKFLPPKAVQDARKALEEETRLQMVQEKLL